MEAFDPDKFNYQKDNPTNICINARDSYFHCQTDHGNIYTIDKSVCKSLRHTYFDNCHPKQIKTDMILRYSLNKKTHFLNRSNI